MLLENLGDNKKEGLTNLIFTDNPRQADRIYSIVEDLTADKELDATFAENDYDADYRILVHNVRAKGQLIPPLFNAYMNLSSTMKTFGTAINESFGGVEETGIIVTINDIYDIKKDRHFSTYKK